MNNVYHFTDFARLPWIIESDDLRPGRNKIGDFPDPDFLWATTNNRGSRTASAWQQTALEWELPLVRLTLDATDFEAWRVVVARYPAWTPDQIRRLEVSGLQIKDDPRTWRCRVEPLPLSRVARFEARTRNTPWRPLSEPIKLSKVDETTLWLV